nr:IS66 family transposase [Photorhabdus stackebrandtii]
MAANEIRAENNRLLSQRVASYASEISRLKALVVKLQRMQFGQRSEKIRQKTERQIREVQEHISHLQEEMADIQGEQPDPALPPALRQSSSRKPLPATLPREIQSLPPAEKSCPECGGELHALGCDISEQLEIISSAFKVIETQRPKLACGRCDGIVQSPMPGKVHGDDIPVPVQEPGSGKPRTGRLWGYVRDDRNAGSVMPPAVWFAYSADRKGVHPQQHLAGYSGVLQADAYGGYRALYETGNITEAACMAHARRKIHDVHVRSPTAVTTEALKRIGELYAIEAEIRGSPAEERLALRKERSAPLMQLLFDWIQQQMATLSRHSETAKAFAYMLKLWDSLNESCRNGWVEIDNNIAENALRCVAVGRKNWLFAGSDSGGERAAILYSLIGTCRLNGVDPEAWLRYVISHIADWPSNKVHELLPWKLNLTNI